MRNIILYSLAILLLFACTKEEPKTTELVAVQDPNAISFSAGFGFDAGTKVAYKYEANTKTEYGTPADGKIQLFWSLKDSVLIGLQQTKKQSTYAVSSIAENKRVADLKAVTEPLLWHTVSTSGLDELKRFHTMYTCYPSTSKYGISIDLPGESYKPAKITATLPADQSTSKVNAPNMRYAYMIGGLGIRRDVAQEAEDGVNIPFMANVTAFKINLKNEFESPITAVRISSASKAMSGQFVTDVLAESAFNTGKSKAQITNTEFPTVSDANKYVEIDLGSDPIAVGTQASLTFFALPQDYNDLSITFYFDAAKSQSYVKELKSSGNPITFAARKFHEINAGDVKVNVEYIFDVDPVTLSFNPIGGDKPFNVTSQKVEGGTTVTPVEWRLQYSTDGINWEDVSDATDETKNSWLWPKWLDYTTTGEVPASGDGGNYISSVTAKATALTAEFEPNAHTLELRNRDTVTGWMDLSLYDLPMSSDEIGENRYMPGGQFTANCYVVNAPGKYKIPMVYGNAIQDGQDNKYAYSNEEAESKGLTSKYYLMSYFIDHAGKAIDQPWVSVAHNITEAKLIWQDEFNLVSDIEIEVDESGSKHHYIRFKVDKDYIHQGNAIIAAYTDDGKVAWSWHIWVTDELLEPINLTSPVIYNNGQPTDPEAPKFVDHSALLPVNLGTVGNAESFATDAEEGREYKSRNVSFRVAQVVGGKVVNSKMLNINQPGFTVPAGGQNNTLYQHGRKDPMLGIDRYDAGAQSVKFKHYFGPTGTMNDGSFGGKKLGSAAAGAGRVTSMIQNPGMVQIQDYSADRMYVNLWNSQYIGEGIDDTYEASKNAYGILMEPSKANIYNPLNYVLTEKGEELNLTRCKSVYDPSPLGYMVPPLDIYLMLYKYYVETEDYTDSSNDGWAYARTSGNSQDISKLNIKETNRKEISDSKGVTISSRIDSQYGSGNHSAFFFPFTGVINIPKEGGKYTPAGYEVSTSYWHNLSFVSNSGSLAPTAKHTTLGGSSNGNADDPTITLYHNRNCEKGAAFSIRPVYSTSYRRVTSNTLEHAII